MALFKIKELLPKTNLLVFGYCNTNLTNQFASNIPIPIKYLFACFYEQKDFFVCSENAPKYIVSNHKQTVQRNNEDKDHYRKIYGFNKIKIQDELSKLMSDQKLSFIWEIKMDQFPTTVASMMINQSGILIGLIDKPCLDGLGFNCNGFYAMDDAGLAVHGRPVGTPGTRGKYHNIAEWKNNISTSDTIKIELTLISRKFDKGNIKFYKNNLLVLEYNDIIEKCEYRLFVSMNASLSRCSIIKFECKIS